MKYDVHEAADIFPLMKGDDFNALVEDIREQEQLEAICLYGGKVLDGRNRLRACEKLGIEPVVEDIDMKDHPDPLAFVISLNLKRRHLNASQLSMCADAAEGLWEKYSKAGLEKMNAGAAEGGKTAGRGRAKKGDSPEFCRTQGKRAPQTRALVGAAFGVSGTTVGRARQVREKGTDKVIAAVEAGDLSVSKAAQIVTLPKAKQAGAMERGTRIPPVKLRKSGPDPLKDWVKRLLTGADRRTDTLLKTKWSEEEREYLLQYISPALEVLTKWDSHLRKTR